MHLAVKLMLSAVVSCAHPFSMSDLAQSSGVLLARLSRIRPFSIWVLGCGTPWPQGLVLGSELLKAVATARQRTHSSPARHFQAAWMNAVSGFR